MSLKAMTLITAAIFLLLAAVTTGASDQLYFMAAAMFAVATVARVAVSTSLRGVQCRRHISDRVFEDDWIEVTLTIINTSKLPKFFLNVEDSLSPWLEAEDAQFLIPVLWSQQEVNVTYRARATKRGWLPVGPLYIGSSDPIGIFYKSITLPTTSTAIVYPLPIEVTTYELEGAAFFGGGMAERMARAGEGMDYHGVRDYHPGDELRRIHWKATARHQRLSVIEFQQTYTADVVIALDLLRGTDVGAGKQTTLEYGIKIAASLARRALDSGSIVALGLHGKDGFQTAVCRREEEFQAILELLAAAEANGEVPMYAMLDQMRPLLTPGVAAFVITPDADSRLAAAAHVLEEEYVGCTAVLFDIPSFIPQESKADTPLPDGEKVSLSKRIRAALSQQRSITEETEVISPSSTPNENGKSTSIHEASVSVIEHMKQVGAQAYLVRKEDDLTDTVRRILGGAE